VFEFIRNSALDARDYFADPRASKPIFQLNQFGARWAVRSSRTRRSSLRITRAASCATARPDLIGADARRKEWRFLRVRCEHYDPSTTDPNNDNARLPFEGNTIPSTRFDPVAKAFMDLYPAPNVPGATRNNYIQTGNFTDKVHMTNLRIDHSFSTRHQMFGRFAYNNQHTGTPAPLPGLANGGGSRTGDTFINAEGISLGDTFTVNSATINELRVGFTRLKEDRGLPFEGQNPPPELRVPGVPDNPATNVRGAPAQLLSPGR
jgi:hypothetical protein